MTRVPVVQEESINNAMVKLVSHKESHSKNKDIQVAVGIVINDKGELLIAKRPEHWLGGGFWEFPGGKIEPNEDSQMAMKRELLEEVGIQVQQCNPLIQLTYIYPERKVTLNAWWVTAYLGQATGMEGQEISWHTPAALNEIKMLPANRAIVVAVQLPDCYLKTPECRDPVLFLAALKKTLTSHSIRLIQLCSPNLNDHDYWALAKHALKICKQHDCKLLLQTTNLCLLDKIDCDGIQLDTQQLLTLHERPLATTKWVGANCYTQDHVSQAEALGIDFVTVGPVLSSTVNDHMLGWSNFSDIVAKANIPIYAHGGILLEDITQAKQLGAQGIVVSSGLWEDN